MTAGGWGGWATAAPIRQTRAAYEARAKSRPRPHQQGGGVVDGDPKYRVCVGGGGGQSHAHIHTFAAHKINSKVVAIGPLSVRALVYNASQALVSLVPNENCAVEGNGEGKQEGAHGSPATSSQRARGWGLSGGCRVLGDTGSNCRQQQAHMCKATGTGTSEGWGKANTNTAKSRHPIHPLPRHPFCKTCHAARPPLLSRRGFERLGRFSPWAARCPSRAPLVHTHTRTQTRAHTRPKHAA